MRRSVQLAAVVIAAVAGAAAAEDEAFWLGGEGYAHKPTVRQEVFEFAAEPAVRLAGRDQYEVAFAAKGLCDATVAIVRRTDGRIVRHLASGVLGPNAPAPLVANSLEQKLLWDGKDDGGQYVRDLANCQVRVGLGLKPAFAGVYGWHPKQNTGEVAGLGTGPEGVFVLEGERRPQVRQFDHQGNYLRTLLPPPASTPRAALEGMSFIDLPTGGQALRVAPYGCLIEPFSHALAAPQQTMAVTGGMLVLGSGGRGWVPKNLVRVSIATGGPVGGQYAWALNAQREQMFGGHHLAASPDGKWIYLSGLTFLKTEYPPTNVGHAVYRVPVGRLGPLTPGEAFFGEVATAKKDAEHLNDPQGIACDAAGRLYVADAGNGRIVVLSPDGKFLKAVAMPDVVHVGIAQAREAIYAMTVRLIGPTNRWTGAVKRIVKLGGFDRPAVTASYEFPELRFKHVPRDVNLMAVDGWADPPTVWATREQGGIVLLADRGDRFEPIDDWRRDVAEAGLVPGQAHGSAMPKVVADPVRPFVYYLPGGMPTAVYRMDTRTGKSEMIATPAPAHDLAFDRLGRLYCRSLKVLSRHDVDQPDWPEAPFDYGEAVAGFKFTGAIHLRGDMPGAKTFQDGFGVGVDGRIAAVSNYYSWDERILGQFGTDKGAIGRYKSSPDYLKARAEHLASVEAPRVAPGRFLDHQGVVHVYDARGQPIARDLLKGPAVGTIGAGIDREGNVYVSVNLQKVVGGRMFLPQYVNGTYVKVPPSGATVLGDWNGKERVALKDPPARSPDLTMYGMLAFEPAKGVWMSQEDRRLMARPDTAKVGAKLWQSGLLWAYPGVSEAIPNVGSCTCPNLRFGLDYYARSFLPEVYRFSVAVVDANGNLVTHIGRYGNADSGRGPDSAVKLGGDELGFAFTAYVSVIDGYLFVSDAGNDRIVRVALGYHAERAADLPAPAD